MCEQLSLRPELRGINKLLRKQRTDLQPPFSRVPKKPIYSRELRGAPLILPIAASRFSSKSLLCHSQKIGFCEMEDIFRTPKSRVYKKVSVVDRGTSLTPE